MAYALVNCDIYTGGDVLHDNAVVVEGERIVATPLLSELGPNTEVVDLSGACVAPGFIDIQVNGGGGVLFNDAPDLATLQTMSAAHAEFGTLNFCPTMITADSATMLAGVRACAAAMGANLGVLGLHYEGPFIAPTKAGVHDKSQVREATDLEVDRIIASADGVLRVVTVAPESVNVNHIAAFEAHGVLVFLGHTDASFEQATAAFRAGAVGVTHLYNAMSQLTGREPGVVGAALADPEIWAGIIADGHHVDFGSVCVAKNAKRKRLILVTDAMPPVGMPDVSFTLGPYEISCRDGRCTTPDGVLAGSALDLASAVRNCVQKCGIAKDEALRMASTYVAELLGVEDELGRVAPGALADLVLLNGQLHVEGIVRRGVLAWPR